MISSLTMKTARGADLVSIVEKTYAIESSENDWLGGIVDAAKPGLAEGQGLWAYLFDASVRPVRVWGFVNRGSRFDNAHAIATVMSATEEYVARAWNAGPSCATASELPGFDDQPFVRELFEPLGMRDLLAVCAHDPSGLGCIVGAPLAEKRSLAADERSLWTRVSSHLTAALRLRKRVAGNGVMSSPAAVITPSGRIEHATGDALVTQARASLKDGVLALESARGSLRRKDPERAVGSWRALVAAKWSLVDHFDNDGKRYLIALSNEPAPSAHELLSARERQIVALAALGRENKIIAYELGLSASTVRVHFANACRKLGTRTRAEAIAKYRETAPRPNH